MRSKLLVLITVLGLMSVPARADLVEIDLVPGSGDGLLTLDTVTGLEWLDLTATSNPAGQSYNAVAAGFGGFTTEQGFRFATVSEVVSLFVNAGVNFPSFFVSQNFAPVSELIGLLGCTGEPGTSQDCELGDFPLSLGFADFDSFDPNLAATLQLQLFISNSLGRANLNILPLQKFISIFNAGAFLVRSSIFGVTIDIKPGSDPNSINPNSKGKIPVAILTTSTAQGEPVDFDATTVDPLSVEFGPDGAREAHGKGHIEDADGDGDLDLLLHFKTRETGIQSGDTEASLTGETFDGQAITGNDAIETVGGAGKQGDEVIDNSMARTPDEFSLKEAYPNPFNPTTTIQYDLPSGGFVTLKVFDVLGREVAVLVQEYQKAGGYSVAFNAEGLPSGLYLYRLQAGEFVQTKKLVLLK